ncbi:S8 family serine peptidase [Cereibacter sphaeroides]|uniref:S8 family serine peptidase n=1 Tax=Cereibacter sphaeroides TaxID=1063 RepID=UPI001F3C4668|nr:S8 family serine peptidase [Cereibacter sphaeroides]MCE6958351.1 S8 family serine peptidase [Cereibacter sphaeroides]MCE6972218.1 S8 family serine peptidase [Cereibacter sphaeroides]
MKRPLLSTLVVGLVLALASLPASAGTKAASSKSVTAKPVATAAAPTPRPWMSSDVGAAWSKGYKGQNTTITVIDDFSSATKLSGFLTGTTQSLRHGEWTKLEASLVAPSATIATQNFGTTTAVKLASGRLNTLNLSYGSMATAGYDPANIGWTARDKSAIDYAKLGKAVVVKSAGNDAIAIGGTNAAGKSDYLGMALTGAASAIYVGALDRNGSTTNLANLASYSNYAGSNTDVQNHFLTVGVTSSQMGLAGTSFAAPIVSGYSAILGSKFTTATPTQITNQLLTTARTDTIAGYDPSIHGKGEASLSRALAPTSIQ